MLPSTFAPAPVGIIGFGAFGQLVGRHLARHMPVLAYDPAWQDGDETGARRADLAEVAACPIVILAVPVARLAFAAAAITPHLQPGALVLDVGSVKVGPAATLVHALPGWVDIVATHPLFGPQSTRHGLRGHKIVLCPVRGRRTPHVARFLRHVLGLNVIVTSPEEHDLELATVQGLTHIVGRVLADMGPLPTRLTTRSFDLLAEAVSMVVGDAPGVFDAIFHANPHALAVRQRFFGAVAKLEADLAGQRQARELPH